MATNPWSDSLASTPGYVSRPASTTYSPAFPALPTVPNVPSIGGPNAATRDWLLQQLGPLSQQNNAQLTNIQAGAKMQLAGYGGYSFGVDNPATAVREDLNLAFDPKKGPGEKEKGALRAEDNAANARGLLYSSFVNQNKASAMQRLSLEAQQIANQYAFNLNQQHTAYSGQVAAISGQWVSLYGQDNQWLAENPPAPPPPPVFQPEGFTPSPGAAGNPAAVRLTPPGMFGALPINSAGNAITGYQYDNLTPSQRRTVAAQYPGFTLVRAGNGILVLKKK